MMVKLSYSSVTTALLTVVILNVFVIDSHARSVDAEVRTMDVN